MKTAFGAVAVLACAGLALATTTKFMDFTATSAENPDIDGMASLKYDSRSDSTHVQVVMHGLLPNTTYGVMVGSDGPQTSNPIAFTTNNGGNGNYQADFLQDATTQNPFVIIYVWDGNPDDVLGITPDEMRGFAFPR